MTFDRQIYDGEALRQAAKDYAPIARIDVEEKAEGYVCHFHDCRYDRELTRMEFANYALEMTAQRSAAW